MTPAKREQLARKNRRQSYESHMVINQAPISAGAKELGHLLVQLLGARQWKSCYASCTKLAAMLAEDFNRKGCQHRDGRGGKGTGRRRLQLSRSAIAARLRELRGIGIVRTSIRPIPGRRGWTWEIRAAGLLRDALRGAWRSWRACFDEAEAAGTRAKTEDDRTVAAALRGLLPGMSAPLDQVLPDTSMSRPAVDVVRSVVRAARGTAARATKIIAAALDADSGNDRGGAEAVGRLRALGILD